MVWLLGKLGLRETRNIAFFSLFIPPLIFFLVDAVVLWQRTFWFLFTRMRLHVYVPCVPVCTYTPTKQYGNLLTRMYMDTWQRELFRELTWKKLHHVLLRNCGRWIMCLCTTYGRVSRELFQFTTCWILTFFTRKFCLQAAMLIVHLCYGYNGVFIAAMNSQNFLLKKWFTTNRFQRFITVFNFKLN